jgi:glycosyltransferase involved in cell wall biosynthesis
MIHKVQKIGINGLFIKWGVNAGTETYITNIIRPWYELDLHGFCFTLYCNQLPPWWSGNKPFFRAEVYPAAKWLAGRIVLEQIFLPLTSFKKLDLLFNPGYVSSIFASTKQIVTIHDGFAWHHLSEIGRLRSLYWRTFIPASAKVASCVIAVSQSTADDVSRFCKIDHSKITVIYEAGGHLGALNPSPLILDRLGLCPSGYFHCVGFFKEIKNPWRILQGFKRYLEITPINERKKLVLVGHVGGRSGVKILSAARSIPGVTVAGRVSDDELVAIYEGSAGLIFPSLYEGFGIPILEAQSLGCPVVISNISSMPEVAGEAAIFVNPLNIEDISRAMLNLGGNNLNDLRQAGRKNFKRFSWQEASDKTLALIKRIATIDP